MKSTNKNTYAVVSIGQLLWDIYPDKKYIGGTAANVAIHCRQLGDEAILISGVGDDVPGGELIDALQKRRVNTDYVQKVNGYPTGAVTITVDSAGIPNYVCTTDVAFDHIGHSQSLRNIINSVNGVYFDLLSQRNECSRQTMYDFLKACQSAFILFDMNIRGWSDKINDQITKSLKYAVAMKANRDEITRLKSAWDSDNQYNLENFIHKLLDDYALTFIAMTCGQNGSLFFDRNSRIETPADKNIKAIDTTGAGDAFAAAIIHQVLRKSGMAEIAAFCNKISAYVTQFAGATPHYTLADID